METIPAPFGGSPGDGTDLETEYWQNASSRRTALRHARVMQLAATKACDFVRKAAAPLVAR